MLKRHFDFGNYYLFPCRRYGDEFQCWYAFAPSDTMLEIIENHLHLELNVFEKTS
jgi:hypothetical protein